MALAAARGTFGGWVRRRAEGLAAAAGVEFMIENQLLEFGHMEGAGAAATAALALHACGNEMGDVALHGAQRGPALLASDIARCLPQALAQLRAM